MERVENGSKPGVRMAEKPEGYEGTGFFATSLEKVVGMARKNSIWPLPFATSCCGIEFMATMGAHYDLARFGSERLSFSPRQADLLMVMGTIAKKWDPCCDKSMNKWPNHDGCFQSAHAQAAEEFLIPIASFRG